MVGGLSRLTITYTSFLHLLGSIIHFMFWQDMKEGEELKEQQQPHQEQ